MAQSIRSEFMQIPVVTRVYVAACVLTTVAVQLSVVSPLQLLYHPKLVREGEIWRLATCFLFYGQLGFSFFFNIIFLYRFCRKLEETNYIGRTADFIILFLFGTTITLNIKPASFLIFLILLKLVATFAVRMIFLGEALTTMLVYIWCRRNPYIQFNLFGLFSFQAPYLPWMLVLLSVLFGGSVMVDIVGIAIGHAYYFMEDVFPSKEGGFRILKTPSIMKRIFDGPQAEPTYQPAPEDRPGGFDWGEGRQMDQEDQMEAHD